MYGKRLDKETALRCVCGSTNFRIRGYRNRKGFTSRFVQYQCTGCGQYKTVPTTEARREAQEIAHRSARILLLDIETIPGEYYAFDPRVEYLPANHMIKDWSVCCWAAKWLFEPEIIGDVVTPQEAVVRDDKRVVGKIWELMNEAQIVVTQNGISFDVKKLNSKFILAGFPPPAPYLNVDTKVIAKNVFGNSYNNLDWMGKTFLGLEGKEHMEFEDWVGCAQGKQESIDKMYHYCKNDVAPLLEDVYLFLRPWATNHPNLNLFTNHDGDVCPKCESVNIKWGLEYPTPQGIWMGFRCTDCGSIGRGTSKKHRIRSVQIR